MKLNLRYILISIISVGMVGAIAFFAVAPPPRNRPGRPGRPGNNAVSPRPEIQIEVERFSSGSNNLANSSDSEPGRELSGIAVSTANDNDASQRELKDEWTRFRGRAGAGVSTDTSIPTEWSDTRNLKWKTKLPGPGSSSPVVTNQFVFLTSYTGYGEDKRQGKLEDLQRQLHCIDRKTGSIIWTKSVKALLPEDPYQGMGIPEHGYATNTPTTDGSSVFAFFGKSGVYAYDMQGNELWNASVGTESGNRGWGTASSPILYKDLVILNASEESQAIIALDKRTGKKVWQAPASILELAYGTPVIVKVDENRDDLVIAVPGEVWGLNPNSGKLAWYVETNLTGNLSPSVVPDGDKVYVFGGYRSSGSLAIKVGGSGNVSKTNTLWTSRNSSYVVTPILYEGTLYWIDDQGMYFSVSAKTGELIEKKRVPGIESRGRPVYASPVCIHGDLYMQTRNSGLFVLEPGTSLKVLSQNKFASDDSVFNGTPAVSGGELFLRSYTHLYCVGSDR